MQQFALVLCPVEEGQGNIIHWPMGTPQIWIKYHFVMVEMLKIATSIFPTTKHNFDLKSEGDGRRRALSVRKMLREREGLDCQDRSAVAGTK